MRPWIIILSSTIIALAVTAAIAVPETLEAPPAEIIPILLPHLPALAVVVLAVYALFATLMVTAGMLAEAVRARNDLVLDQHPRDAGIGASGSRRMTEWLARFAPREARAEIARSHYILLARSHVFSALIALAGMIGLGLAQDHGSLPFSLGTVPTISAILVLAGVLLLTLLGRIAIDVTVEPLLEAIARLSPDQIASDPLQRAAESLERACEAIRSGGKAPAHQAGVPERLVTVLDDGNRALLDAVNRLSANTETLEASIHSSAQTIETAVRSAAAQTAPTDHVGTGAEPDSFAGLQAAIEQLTGLLRQLVAMPAGSSETGVVPGSVPVRREPPPPRLAGELRQLLQEIEAR
jgi:hypothetical protein